MALTLAAFSAEFRVFDAWRLDRDALGRSFRHALHAYRRFRRKPARRHTERHAGNTPAAGLGRRTEPRPPVHRLGRNSRHDHASLDAVAGPSALPCRRRRCGSRIFFTAARALRAIAQAGLYPSNCRILDAAGGLQHRRRRRQRRDHGAGFESARPSARMPGWRARSNAAPIMAARRSGKAGDAHREGAAGRWRNAFIRMPYAREFLTPARYHQRHVRDRDHLGSLRSFP